MSTKMYFYFRDWLFQNILFLFSLLLQIWYGKIHKWSDHDLTKFYMDENKKYTYISYADIVLGPFGMTYY